MKKGANIACFPEDWTLEEVFAAAQEAGFAGVEPNMRAGGELSLETTPQEVEEIRKLAERYGIELPSMSTVLFWQYSYTSPDPEFRQQAKLITQKMIDDASLLGIKHILVVPGVVNEQTPYDRAYQLSQEILKELGDYAGQRGVIIGVENVWNKFLLSPLEMKRFIDEIGHPHVQVYFDAGNVLVNGYPEQWIRILGGRIIKVHIKDFRTAIGNISGFTHLLHGDVRWNQVMDALEEVGYDDYLTAEIGPHRYPKRSLKETAQAMDLIINRQLK